MRGEETSDTKRAKPSSQPLIQFLGYFYKNAIAVSQNSLAKSSSDECVCESLYCTEKVRLVLASWKCSTGRTKNRRCESAYRPPRGSPPPEKKALSITEMPNPCPRFDDIPQCVL